MPCFALIFFKNPQIYSDTIFPDQKIPPFLHNGFKFGIIFDCDSKTRFTAVKVLTKSLHRLCLQANRKPKGQSNCQESTRDNFRSDCCRLVGILGKSLPVFSKSQRNQNDKNSAISTQLQCWLFSQSECLTIEQGKGVWS